MTPTLAALTLVLSGAPVAFPDALSRPLLAKVEFNWPKPAAFSAKWNESSAKDRARTVLRLSGAAEGWYVVSSVTNGEGKYVLERLIGQDDWAYTDSIEGESLTLWRWEKEKKENALVAERLEGTVADALVPHTYVQTLLAANGSLYSEKSDVGGKGLRDLIDDLTAKNEKTPGSLEQWARAQKSDDALFERLRSYAPRGSCSMDTHPQEAARVFAELAYARGDLGRFLQLQVRIMGDRFDRTAWSSYGEAAHDTESGRLASTGIDVEQFILGLGVATQTEGPELGTWRQARAIQEAKLEKTMLPKLEALATSPKLDAYNRLLATQAWFFVQVRQERGMKGDATRAEALARAKKLDLHFLAREWLAQ